MFTQIILKALKRFRSSHLLKPIGRERQGSSLWTLLEHLWVPATQFLTAIPLVYGLGLDGYGIWVYIIGISSLIGAMTPGIAMAATQLVSGNQDPNDRGCAAYMVVFGGLAATVFFSTLGVGIFYLIITYFTPTSLITISNISIKISAVAAVLGIFIQLDLIVAALMRAKLQYRESSLIDIWGRGISLITLAAAALSGADLILLLCINAALIFIRTAVKTYFALNHETVPTREDIKKILPAAIRLSLLQWIQNFNAITYSFSDLIILGIFMPPSVVAVAALASQLASKVHSVPRAYLTPLVPELIELHKDQNNSKFIVVLREAERRRTIILLGLIPIVLLSGPIAIFLALNMKPAISDIFFITSFYVAGYTIMSLSTVPYLELVARGRIGLTGILNIFASIANLLSSLGLGYFFGVYGIAISKAMYYSPYLALKVKKIISSKKREL